MYWFRYYPEYVNQKDNLARLVGPIVYDLEQMFLSMPPAQLEKVFLFYEAEFGKSAATYAKKTFKRWKAREVKMSGKVAKRLLNFVPQFLSVEERYSLVEKICDHHRPQRSRYIEIDLGSPHEGLHLTKQTISEFIGLSASDYLPDEILEMVHWLNDQDAVAARAILSKIDNQKSLIASQLGQKEMQTLIQNLNANQRMSGTQTIEFPQGRIILTFKSKRKGLLGFLFS